LNYNAALLNCADILALPAEKAATAASGLDGSRDAREFSSGRVAHGFRM
jgi:hypothetical protein